MYLDIQIKVNRFLIKFRVFKRNIKFTLGCRTWQHGQGWLLYRAATNSLFTCLTISCCLTESFSWWSLHCSLSQLKASDYWQCYFRTTIWINTSLNKGKIHGNNDEIRYKKTLDYNNAHTESMFYMNSVFLLLTFRQKFQCKFSSKQLSETQQFKPGYFTCSHFHIGKKTKNKYLRKA